VFGTPQKFSYAPIVTTKASLIDVDVYQTVYFPNLEHGSYRASITGNVLTMEWLKDPDDDPPHNTLAAQELQDAFGIPGLRQYALCTAHEGHTQSFGKISPIDEGVRRGLLLRLTKEYGVYSLGRFATWRNVLLDDVVHDAAVIKRMIYDADDYDRALGAH
jgi:hypothetical protein